MFISVNGIIRFDDARRSHLLRQLCQKRGGVGAQQGVPPEGDGSLCMYVCTFNVDQSQPLSKPPPPNHTHIHTHNPTTSQLYPPAGSPPVPAASQASPRTARSTPGRARGAASPWRRARLFRGRGLWVLCFCGGVGVMMDERVGVIVKWCVLCLPLGSAGHAISSSFLSFTVASSRHSAGSVPRIYISVRSEGNDNHTHEREKKKCHIHNHTHTHPYPHIHTYPRRATPGARPPPGPAPSRTGGRRAPASGGRGIWMRRGVVYVCT